LALAVELVTVVADPNKSPIAVAAVVEISTVSVKLSAVDPSAFNTVAVQTISVFN
jgi:hypothetical protein